MKQKVQFQADTRLVVAATEMSYSGLQSTSGYTAERECTANRMSMSPGCSERIIHCRRELHGKGEVGIIH